MITIELSKQISVAALRAARQKQNDQLFKRLVDTSKALYVNQFGYYNMAQMDALPEGWFEERTSFSIRLRGEWRTLYFTAERFNIAVPLLPTEYGQFMRMPGVHINGNFENVPKGLIDAFIEADDAWQAFKKEIAGIHEQTQATLRQFTNPRVLVAEWPEMAPYVPAYALVKKKKESRALFNPASLNATIGLPPQ